jgi:CxxC motif-containing protein (DUF1111 family)
MRRIAITLAAAAAALPLLAAPPAAAGPLAQSVGNQGVLPPHQPARDPSPGGLQLGDPLPDLTDDELGAFQRGREVFMRRFTPSTGLGPFYNATSCVSCHSKPVLGGSANLYRNFFVAAYGSLFSQGALPPFVSVVVPAFGSGADHATTTEFTLEVRRPDLPDTFFGLPVFAAQRNSIPIFGVGLFEFVSDATILANADPSDSNADGISGRHNIDAMHVGRLGMKAQSNNIELFTRAPLQNQMGITTNPFLGLNGMVSCAATAALQVSGNPNNPTIDHDPVPDPELSHQDLGDLIAFSRFLAPPQPRAFSPAALNGEALFAQVRCTDCHIPSLPSSRGPVNAYTDLLIHFMGAEMTDNMNFGGNGATGAEFRTQPLWGVSHFGPFLHDGRAATLSAAIAAHGGEATISRNLYNALTPAQRADIITFLEHL